MEKIREIVFQNDPYRMNWLRPDYAYAQVNCPPGIAAAVRHTKEGDVLRTEITLRNTTEKPVFTSLRDIAIAFPLEDRYDDSRTCMERRCHTHIFCGGEMSYIMALRMGGTPPHLGMVLTKGRLGGYSVERDTEKMSNDRGCFWLHPSPMALYPGEETAIGFAVFPHAGKQDFYKQAAAFAKIIQVEASAWVVFRGEECRLAVMPSFPAACVQVNGETLAGQGGRYEWIYRDTQRLGERVFSVCADGLRTACRILVTEPPERLAQARCEFIASHQQAEGPLCAAGACGSLDGAYLAYDNEEEHLYYSRNSDYNGGRERVGMGLLMAAYLQREKERPGGVLDASLDASLRKYVAYVERELVDKATGAVCNDFGRDDSYKRLYNAPWFAELYVELYRLYGKKEYLKTASAILRKFYQDGGAEHYSIELPILSLAKALEAADMPQERGEMETLFRRHADNIVQIGYAYPPSEVNFEQSIVAPAANILLQTYLLTGENAYLEAGRKQLAVLELFNGTQPDYHLYETAIRHWDGYWFGKRKFYGDTFPHYWSALSGICFALYFTITGEKMYAQKAKDSLRGVLPLIFPDGRASCAYVFPASVNGKQAGFYDPYANDQDWALYFTLRMARDRGAKG